MNFNKNWTKEDNDLLREFIKDNKSSDYIREYFTNDKLFYHPNKKYYQSNKSCLPIFKNTIKSFDGYINEIQYTELETDFTYDFENSKQFKNEFNYIYKFKTYSGNKYVVDFIYLKDKIGKYKNEDIYNISFTTLENRNIDNYKDYEKSTFLKEEHEIIKRLIFIIKDFNKRFGNNIYLIGESEDIRKTKWYLSIIKDNFDNIEVTKDVSSFTNNLDAYYIEFQ